MNVVVLTIIRRALIILVAIGLVVDGGLLVYARSAQSHRSSNVSGSYRLKVYVDSKQTAEDVKKLVDAQKLDPAPTTKVSQVTRVRRDPTGQWTVAMRFRALDSSMVDSTVKALKSVQVPVVKDQLEDGGYIIRVNQVFGSKDEAERKAAEISRKGPFQLAAEEATKKVSFPAYRVEVTVGDSNTADTLREKITGQYSKVQVEQE